MTTACALASPWALFRKVDQSSVSGVDRRGSGWISVVSWTYHCSKPSQNIGKRGTTANGPTSCVRANLSLIKIKREKPGLSGAQNAGTLDGGVIVAF